MEKQNKQISSLAGKRVILLGASSGLGLATAKAAAAEGAQVVIVSGNQQRIDQAVKELRALAPESSALESSAPESSATGSSATIEGHAVDLSKEENIRSFFNRIGNFDHLVYTAGENISLHNISETEIDQARQFFNLRYWGAFAAVKYAAPHINPGGSINLTSGIASTRPGKGWSLASGICGAMEGFTRAMAVELAPIRVNSVVPGVVRTNLWAGMTAEQRENMYTTLGGSLLVGRVGEAEDIAQAFVYLMKQSFGTGQNLTIDGGAVLV